MRIAVALPADPQAGQAGVRIRYGRLQEALSRLGHSIDCLCIDDLAEPASLVHDAYIVSKVYDARAALLGESVKRLGKLFGIDLFDNYFSQRENPKLARLRHWLDAMASRVDFVLCSTPGMREVAVHGMPGIPVHRLGDAAEPVAAETLIAGVEARLEAARSARVVEIAWFGIGDNPLLPVGLTDLSAWAGELDRMRGHGFDLRLAVLTNRRAMTPAALAGLRRLSVPWVLAEWSESAEREALSRATLAFLPVSAQPFSRVKSNNRAVTALSAGAQVLSVGYPLYAGLDPWIYRDGVEFLDDLRAGRARLGRGSVGALVQQLAVAASPEREARGLVEFLSALQPRPPAGRVSLLVHGFQTHGSLHKFARRHGAMSVASPLAQDRLNYDVRIELSEDGQDYVAYVATKRLGLIAKGLRPRFAAHGTILETDYARAAGSALFPGLRPRVASLLRTPGDAALSAAYADTMRDTAELLRQLIPDASAPAFAEHSERLPWRVPAQTAAR
jgi:hypothetical protein